MAGSTGLREKLRESSESIQRVFHNPGLRRVNLAFAGSIIGDWAFGLVISLYAYDKGGATTLGVVGVVRYLMMAVLAPLLSTLADRYHRKLVMIGTDLARGDRHHRRRRCRDRWSRARRVRARHRHCRARDRVPSGAGRVAAVARAIPPS